MITFMLGVDTGITYDNIPESVLQKIVGSPNQTGDGGPRFGVNDEDRLFVTDELLRHGDNNDTRLVVRRIGENTVTLSILAEATPEAATAENENTTEPGDEQAEYRPTQEPRNEGIGAVETEVNEERTEPAPVNGLFEITTAVQHRPLDEVSAMELIATSMENAVTNNSKDLHEKIAAFEKEWTRLLNTKREIDEATASVRDNPIIRALIGQVEELRNDDNLVNEIYFISDGFIVVKTNPIITDNEVDGHRRLIGRMMIKIDIKPIAGKTSSSAKPVEFQNLDNAYRNGNTLWQCGHVKNIDGKVSVCWGTAWENLYDALERRDLHHVMDVIIRFLKNPNGNDAWGCYSKYFPAYEGAN